MSVHNKYTGCPLKHLLLRHMYNLPLPILLCYAQALRSETSYCYCDHVTLSACLSVSALLCVTLYCAVLYILLVYTLVERYFWDRSLLHSKVTGAQNLGTSTSAHTHH